MILLVVVDAPRPVRAAARVCGVGGGAARRSVENVLLGELQRRGGWLVAEYSEK